MWLERFDKYTSSSKVGLRLKQHNVSNTVLIKRCEIYVCQGILSKTVVIGYCHRQNMITFYGAFRVSNWLRQGWAHKSSEFEIYFAIMYCSKK